MWLFDATEQAYKNGYEAGKKSTLEIVRCIDCKYYHDFETHFDCRNIDGLSYVRPFDFCSYGERKNNDSNNL